MADVSIGGDDLTVVVLGTDRLWALTSRLTIPLAHVRDRSRAVVIELHDERHQRLVLSVRDPRATVELVERAISRA